MSVQPPTTPMKQLNVLVLGDSRVGKTSLIHTLLAYGSSLANSETSADDVIDRVSKMASQANDEDFIEYQSLELDSLSLQFTEYHSASTTHSTSSNSSSKTSNSSINAVKEFIARRSDDSPVHVCLHIVSPQSIDGAHVDSNGQRWSSVDYVAQLQHLAPVKIVLTRCDSADDANDVLKPVKSSIGDSPVRSVASTWSSSQAPRHDHSTKSLFQRRFRWGTFDLLDSNCSDFKELWQDLTNPEHIKRWRERRWSEEQSLKLSSTQSKSVSSDAESKSVLVPSSSSESLQKLEQNGRSVQYATLGQMINYPMTLASVRDNLIRLEDSIIFALIERSQFKQNLCVYDPKRWNIPEWNGDFADYFLHETERICARVRRYTSPDEHPFSLPSELPRPILPPASYPNTLVKNEININSEIREHYRTKVLTNICSQGDDGNYGSTAVCDVTCLQQLSKRIHYGKFVAEIKFLDNKDVFTQLIMANNEEADDEIMKLITNSKVEEQVIKRVGHKMENYSAKISSKQNSLLEPKHLQDLYKEFIIPMTKVVEVKYLKQRLG